MNKLTIVKVGGEIVHHSELFKQFLNEFVLIEGNKILVHGGGKEATSMLDRLNIPTTFFAGRRVTDAETLKVVSMVYAGWTNKMVVTTLQSAGLNAIGLSGADGNLILSQKRSNIEQDYGYVGDIIKVNHTFINQLLNIGLTPAICPITHDEHGQLLNTNADTIASSVAQAMSLSHEVSLRYCFEYEGVRTILEDPNSSLQNLNALEAQNLILSGAISGGMIPKVETAIQAKKKLVHEVAICGINNLLSLRNATFIYA